MFQLRLLEQTFFLLPERAAFWVEKKMLLIADAHLGKITHFRKAGIPLPSTAIHKDFEKLTYFMKKFQPERVLFLGDLFHSNYNKEWEIFSEWRQQFSSIEFELIRGNHDIIHPSNYIKADIKLHIHSLPEPPFIFVHDAQPDEIKDKDLYFISGHIHPGVRLWGMGRNSEVLPCFLFRHKEAVLPAFGNFTGLHLIEPRKGDDIFVIAGTEVMEVR